MPIVFQTGEREPRPLFPTDLVYSSAQKVADILQIPLQDPAYLLLTNAWSGSKSEIA